MPKPEKLRYVLYARKSSESEDRQIQSIDDQVSYLTKLANAEGLQIVDVLTEAKSAKQPYGRIKFSEMMDRIEQGHYDGILSWKLDRLSRNSADSGRLQWLVQSGVIKVIRTAEREYTPSNKCAFDECGNRNVDAVHSRLKPQHQAWTAKQSGTRLGALHRPDWLLE